MEGSKMKSSFLNLNWKDLVNAAIRAGVMAFLTALLQVLQAGPIEWTLTFWTPTLTVAGIAVVGSLIKSFATNSDGEFIKNESK
jgi:hypothetical protein